MRIGPTVLGRAHSAACRASAVRRGSELRVVSERYVVGAETPPRGAPGYLPAVQFSGPGSVRAGRQDAFTRRTPADRGTGQGQGTVRFAEPPSCEAVNANFCASNHVRHRRCNHATHQCVFFSQTQNAAGTIERRRTARSSLVLGGLAKVAHLCTANVLTGAAPVRRAFRNEPAASSSSSLSAIRSRVPGITVCSNKTCVVKGHGCEADDPSHRIKCASRPPW